MDTITSLYLFINSASSPESLWLHVSSGPLAVSEASCLVGVLMAPLMGPADGPLPPQYLIGHIQIARSLEKPDFKKPKSYMDSEYYI